MANEIIKTQLHPQRPADETNIIYPETSVDQVKGLPVVSGSEKQAVVVNGDGYSTAPYNAPTKVRVGETQTLPEGYPASVQNVGTPEAPILNFQIPQGKTGMQGPKGDSALNLTDGTGDKSIQQSDCTSSGANSFSTGHNTKANGVASHAEGTNSVADGNNSHVEGIGSRANGGASHAEGVSSIADGGASHAEGSYAIARGQYSHAGGFSTEANGNISFTHGSYLKAEKNVQFVVGYGNDVKDNSLFEVGNGVSSTPSITPSDAPYSGGEIISAPKTRSTAFRVTRNGYAICQSGLAIGETFISEDTLKALLKLLG